MWCSSTIHKARPRGVHPNQPFMNNCTSAAVFRRLLCWVVVCISRSVFLVPVSLPEPRLQLLACWLTNEFKISFFWRLCYFKWPLIAVIVYSIVVQIGLPTCKFSYIFEAWFLKVSTLARPNFRMNLGMQREKWPIFLDALLAQLWNDCVGVSSARAKPITSRNNAVSKLWSRNKAVSMLWSTSGITTSRRSIGRWIWKINNLSFFVS